MLIFIEQSDSTAKSRASVTYSFEQLFNKFATVYKSMARHENLVVDTSDVAVSVNQMRTILDEFVKSK